MSARQKEWARRARKTLMEELGQECANCGETRNLTFDCILPQGHRHHALSTDQRMTFYRSQHRIRNVQVLCHWCNSLKGRIDSRVAAGANDAAEKDCYRSNETHTNTQDTHTNTQDTRAIL